MNSKTSDWFEVSLRYRKILEDGREKSVTEQYVVDSISFSEAEERILKEMGQFIRGDYSVKAIKKLHIRKSFLPMTERGINGIRQNFSLSSLMRIREKKSDPTLYILSSLPVSMQFVNQLMRSWMVLFSTMNPCPCKKQKSLMYLSISGYDQKISHKL